MTLISKSIVASTPVVPGIEVREAGHRDLEAIAEILYGAFRAFHQSHGFDLDFPNLESATGLAAQLIDDPNTYGVVATAGDRVVGSNFLSEGDAIKGVGPISVDPTFQNTGVGRTLMHAVLRRAATGRGVRLLQDAFNTKSMALYASLGFRVREPVVVMTGRPTDELPSGMQVRAMRPGDLIAADDLARKVHGYSRAVELRGALAQGTPVVLERDRRLVGYITAPNLWLMNHGVAETGADLTALILGAAAQTDQPIGFLAPIRNAEFFRWAIGQGLKIVKPMTLMTRGEYSDPRGAWFPSVIY